MISEFRAMLERFDSEHDRSLLARILLLRLHVEVGDRPDRYCRLYSKMIKNAQLWDAHSEDNVTPNTLKRTLSITVSRLAGSREQQFKCPASAEFVS